LKSAHRDVHAEREAAREQMDRQRAKKRGTSAGLESKSMGKSSTQAAPTSGRLALLRKMQRTPHGSAKAIQAAWRQKAARRQVSALRAEALAQREAEEAVALAERKAAGSVKIQSAIRGRQGRRVSYCLAAEGPMRTIQRALVLYQEKSSFVEASADLLPALGHICFEGGELDVQGTATILLRLKVSPQKRMEIVDALPASNRAKMELLSALPTHDDLERKDVQDARKLLLEELRVESEHAVQKAGLILAELPLNCATKTAIISNLPVSEHIQNELQHVLEVLEEKMGLPLKFQDYRAAPIGMERCHVNWLHSGSQIQSGERLKWSYKELLDENQKEMLMQRMENPKAGLQAEEAEEMIKAFSFFDVDHNGQLTVKELVEKMRTLGDSLSILHAMQLVESADPLRNGYIEYHGLVEFLQAEL